MTRTHPHFHEFHRRLIESRLYLLANWNGTGCCYINFFIRGGKHSSRIREWIMRIFFITTLCYFEIENIQYFVWYGKCIQRPGCGRSVGGYESLWNYYRSNTNIYHEFILKTELCFLMLYASCSILTLLFPHSYPRSYPIPAGYDDGMNVKMNMKIISD